MACSSCCSVNFMAVSSDPNKPLTSSTLLASKLSPSFSQIPLSSININLKLSRTQLHKSKNDPFVVLSGIKAEPLKVMISGAPASGKGTQCQIITKKYDLVHIAAGDLLRAEVAAGTGNGRLAKEYMEKGQLVPDEIVVTMVERLLQPDSQEKGWLLDGYPRSS